MKKLIFLFILCFQFTIGQNDVPQTENKKEDELIELDEVPVYPGCEKGDNNDKQNCMSKAIQKHIEKRFNVQLAEELNLPGGNYTIYAMFKVNKEGNVVNIKARAPNKTLKKEAIRVIKLLPKIKAGVVNEKAVTVPYAIPIYFKVEDSKEERKEKRKLKKLAKKRIKEYKKRA